MNIILGVILETKDKEQVKIIMPCTDMELMEKFEKLKSCSFSVKMAYSNVGLIIYYESKEFIGFESVERRDLNNLQYGDIDTFRKINQAVKRLNDMADIGEVKALTDYITPNIEELLEIVERKCYEIIPYKTKKEVDDYYNSSLNGNKLLTEEGYYKTAIGKLHFFDEQYNKELKGNEIIYGIPKNYKTGICSICCKPYKNWGHNADPINYGRCCDDCEQVAVAPMRDFNLKSVTMIRRLRIDREALESIKREILKENEIVIKVSR